MKGKRSEGRYQEVEYRDRQGETEAIDICSPCSPNKRRECTGKCRQFNGFGLLQAGSGPGGRWFKSNRSDYDISRSLIDLHCDCVMFSNRWKLSNLSNICPHD